MDIFELIYGSGLRDLYLDAEFRTILYRQPSIDGFIIL